MDRKLVKRWLIILLLCPLLCYGQWSNEPLNVSFAHHTLTCALVSFSAAAVTKAVFPRCEHSWAVGIAAGMAVGLLHEFLETKPDQWDLVGDMVGSCIGVTLTIPLKYKRR